MKGKILRTIVAALIASCAAAPSFANGSGAPPAEEQFSCYGIGPISKISLEFLPADGSYRVAVEWREEILNPIRFPARVVPPSESQSGQFEVDWYVPLGEYEFDHLEFSFPEFPGPTGPTPRVQLGRRLEGGAAEGLGVWLNFAHPSFG